MATLRVFCDQSNTPEYKTDVIIDSSVNSRYPDSVVIELSACNDLGYIEASINQCKPVSVRHGVYTAWVKRVITFNSGKVDRLIVEATPFYRDGQTVEFDDMILQQSKLDVPPNGGNAQGVIKKIDYTYLGGGGVQNIYIFFEECNPNDFLLESRIGGNGPNIFSTDAHENSYQTHLVNFPTQTTTYTTGTYPITTSLRKTLEKPRNVVYSEYPPTSPPPALRHRLASTTQGIATPSHTSGAPIAYTGSFKGALSLNHTIALGSLVAPTTAFYALDFIAFYPITHFRALNVPFNFGNGNVSYTRVKNKVVGRSGGLDAETSGDVRFSPYSSTSLYLVGTQSAFGILPKGRYRLKVQTLSAFRMTCERLP